MKLKSVCILGGSGFVGRAIAEQLASRGVRVRIVTRVLQRAMPMAVLPTVEIMTASPHDVATLKRCFHDMEGVINLVGILHETRNQTFRRCHAELPRDVAEACRANGVRHLLHMSALGASRDGPSEYQRSKAAGEDAVRAAGDALPFTIFRPSIIFGEGDRFVNLFAKMARLFPLIPLAGAKSRLQPVWVEDVARAFAGALGNPRCFGQTYELAGPKVYTLEEIVGYAGEVTGHRARILPLGSGLASLQAFTLEHLPGKLMTRDNLRSLSVDNVASQPFPDVFGFQPSALEAVAPEYLAATTTRARYAAYREHARR
jgi:NADH dehydrogenase